MIPKKTPPQRKRESMAKIIKRTKRDGSCSYCLRVSNGYDREGRQVLVNRTYTPPPGLTGRKLERELQRQAVEFEQEVRNGLNLDTDMKLDDLLDRWFEQYIDKKCKPKTASEYRYLRPRISAALGHLKVSQIKPSHLMLFYNDLETAGARKDSTYTATTALLELLPRGQRQEMTKAAGIGGRSMTCICAGQGVSRTTAEKVSNAAGLPLSKAFAERAREGGKLNGNTVQHYHRMLSSVFTKAVQWGIVQDNPVKRAEPPKGAAVSVSYLEEADVAKLLAALHDAPPQYSAIVQLGLFTGMRRGEICGLRWSNIDFENDSILIGHTVTETRVDGHLQMIQKDLTKNNSSFRSLPLVAPIKELLNEKRKSIYECKKLFKSGYCSKYSDYVCVNEIGELIRPRTLSDNFKRIIKKNNIRNLRLYDCRHTAASIMLKNGVSMKQIQMILGHSDYATTANIYSHLDYADKVSATKEMKNILYGNE